MASLIDIRAGRTPRVATIFLVSDLIGEGRFSEVYKAYNHMSKTDLALKIYRNYDQLAHDVAKRENEILEKLKELNTEYFPDSKGFKLHKIGNNNHPVLAMELCEYQHDEQNANQVSLEEVILSCSQANEPVNIAQDFWEKTSLQEFILELTDALWMLHKVDIIHRDIKPFNILLKKKYSEKVAKPFFLDFNTSLQSGIQSYLGGTDCYLPPEVIADPRREPSQSDDLWAIARIISELIYGRGANIDDNDVTPHKFVNFDIADMFLPIIRKALSASPGQRFQSAEEFHRELENYLVCHPVDSCGSIDEGVAIEEDSHVSSDEIIWARENELRIRRDLLTQMSGADEIPVFKEIKNNVSFLFSTLTSENTKSFELKSEIIRLGTDAIPSIFEESYKLAPGTYEFQEIAQAVGELALKDTELAKKSIKQFCLSSDYTVRRLCQEVSKIIKFFPPTLIYNIIANDALFVPEERVDIADMCIRYSDDDQVLMPLNQYMCREYLIDRNSYRDLKDKIALRVCELKFEKRALLVVQDTQMRIWEELADYAALSDELKKIYDSGISQLFADAYSSLGEEALGVAKRQKLPNLCNKGKIPIRKTFLYKLAQRYGPARKWLFEIIRSQPERNLIFAADKLFDKTEEEKKIIIEAKKNLNIKGPADFNVRAIYENYLIHGYGKDRFLLVKAGQKTIELIKHTMRTSTDETKTKNILKLLDQFHDRHRYEVVEIFVENWGIFAHIDYDLTTHNVANYDIPNSRLKDAVIKLLEADVDHPRRGRKARLSIQKIIERA